MRFTKQITLFILLSLGLSCCSYGADPKPGDRMVLTIKGVEYAFRWCPPGTFMMGSPESEKERLSGETQHQVTLTKGFWMLETPVTQEMWESVTDENRSHFRRKKSPVERVSWNDCLDYIGQLNALNIAPDGYKFSLPTESQWEYACRAGTETPFNFGDVLNGDKANCDGKYPYGTKTRGEYLGKTSEVGLYPVNAWGLYDMHGNVWEWCLDWYGEYPNGSVTDPVGPLTGSKRVMRGGSWYSDAEYCRSAVRASYVPSLRFRCYENGLRLSLVRVEEPTPVVVEVLEDKQAGDRMVLTIKGVDHPFRWCPAGVFMMGREPNLYGNPRQRQVTLTLGFWMLETPVTQEMWVSVTGNNPSSFKGSKKLPVESVFWNDIEKYINQLNALNVAPAGYKFSLPTEAQWEYACRADTTTPFHFGDTLNGDKANFSKNPENLGENDKTSVVGSYPANAWGLYDMHGNVREQCLDWYKGRYTSSSEKVTDPVEDKQGRWMDMSTSRVFRGGSWGDPAEYCRSASRYDNAPARWNHAQGLRLALVQETSIN